MYRVIWLCSIWPVVYAHYFVVWCITSCNCGQPGCSSMIKASTIGNSFVRMLIFICRCVHYPCGAGVWCFLYSWAININSIIAYACNTRPAGIINIVYSYIIIVGYLPDLLHTRTTHISNIVIDIGIINNSCILNDSYRTCTGRIIIINNRAVDISLWCACPIIIRRIVSTAY